MGNPIRSTMALTPKENKIQIAKWIHRTFTKAGLLDWFREMMEEWEMRHRPQYDFCKKHGSLVDGPCSCEQTSRPSDTIRRNAPIHFQMRGTLRGTKTTVDGCGAIPLGCTKIGKPVLDEDGNPKMRNTMAGDVRGLEVANWVPVIDWVMEEDAFQPSTLDVREVTCGNCRARIGAALKYHDKMEAKSKQ